MRRGARAGKDMYRSTRVHDFGNGKRQTAAWARAQISNSKTMQIIEFSAIDSALGQIAGRNMLCISLNQSTVVRHVNYLNPPAVYSKVNS